MLDVQAASTATGPNQAVKYLRLEDELEDELELGLARPPTHQPFETGEEVFFLKAWWLGPAGPIMLGQQGQSGQGSQVQILALQGQHSVGGLGSRVRQPNQTLPSAPGNHHKQPAQQAQPKRAGRGRCTASPSPKTPLGKRRSLAYGFTC